MTRGNILLKRGYLLLLIKPNSNTPGFYGEGVSNRRIYTLPSYLIVFYIY